jgi:16S rRNA U516 pseudouridylate synthase RsuA-like enzyme
MLEQVGTPVLALKRTGYSFLTLGNLKPGHFRHLTSGEVKRLKIQGGLP